MKNNFKFLTTILALMAVFLMPETGWGQAPVNTVLWAETWSGSTTSGSANDNATPSANYGHGTTVYNNGTVTYDQSANSVYVRNENLAGGTAPELMLTSGKTWTISNIPTGDATKLTLTYKSNNTKSSVTCSTSGTSITGSSKSYAITTGGASTITLVFSCSGNTRIDDVELKVETAGGSTPITYTVTYDANGGSGTMSDSNSPYSSGATVTVLDNEFTRANYTFDNWNTAADGSGTYYDADDTFTISANTTLYAQWTENSGGCSSPATLTATNLELTGSYSNDTEITIGGITYVHTDLMKNSNNIQVRASSGTIRNTTPYSGNIINVAITNASGQTARPATIYGSADGATWTQVATGSGTITANFSGLNYKYFKITRGSNAAYWEKIEITYSCDDGSLEDSDLAITNASTDLTFDLYNNSTAQVINYTTSSTGAITITPSSPTSYYSYVHDATAKTITVTPLAVTPSAQTVTISQVADATYDAGEVTFTVSVTNSTPSYTITAQSNNTSYGTVSLSGSIITASPATGYQVSTTTPFTVSPANSATIVQNGNEFTVTPSANTTVTINFEAIPTYTVTLGDDNTTLTETSGGAGVTLPARSNASPYTFAGWVTSNITTETTTAPTIIPAGSYHPASDITLYPVYTRTEGSGTPTTEWHKVDDFTNITAGTYALLTINASNVYYAFNGTITSGHGQSTAGYFTFDANNVATSAPSGTLELQFIASGSGFKVYNASKGYLYASEASSGHLAWHSTEDSYWSYTSSNWTYKSNSAYLRCYDNTFRTYGNNIGNPIGLAQKVEVSSSTTYYVSVITFTVTYDGNGATSGTVPTDNTAYASGATVTVLGPGDLAKTGHTFAWWATDEDGEEDLYEEGDQFNIAANTTLYAQWDVNTYNYTLNVTGDDNEALAVLNVDGSDLSSGDKIAYGKEVTVDVATNTGYTYTVSVKDASNNDVTVTNDKFTMPASDVTVTVTTASVPSYTIIFNPGNGTCGTSSVTEYSGTSITLPTATPSTACATAGWTFAGWATANVPDGTTTAPTLLTGSYTPTSDLTLYAVYSITEGEGISNTTNVFGSGSYSNNTITWSVSGVVTVTQEQNGAQTAPNSSYVSAPRWYSGNLITITPSVSINSITITATTEGYATALANSTYSNASSSVTSSTVTITPTNGSNPITIMMGGQSRLSSMIVNYSSGTTTYATSPSCTVLTATTVTIDASGITNTDVYTSTTAGSLSATVKENVNNTTISGATVAWSSSDESVATIASNGAVTLVAAGTTIITASYAGETGQYLPSSATYTLNVTSSAPVCEDVDMLTYSFVGVTSSSYDTWTGKTDVSDAVYAGNSAGGTSGSGNTIQLRDGTGSGTAHSGIVTTTSGGKARSIKVEWNDETASNRTLDVYGKNTAYSTADDLYNSSSGTLLGSIVCGTSTVLNITDDYEYIGMRSKSGAMYLDEIFITWERDCDACETPNGLAASNVTSVSANLSWEDYQDSYNVQYRKSFYYEGFESGIPSTWTKINSDGDGYNWIALSDIPTVYSAYSSLDMSSWAHSGSDAACSSSFYNESSKGVLETDQWLVSPKLDLQGTLSFFVSSTYHDLDTFEVRLSTTGTSISDFTTELRAMGAAPYRSWEEVSIDLSSCSGQGYIAIHHKTEDGYFLVVDDFGIYGPWQTAANSPVFTSTINIAGLDAETTYEWQVQGINSSCTDGVTDWSASETFTTKAIILDCETEDFSGVTPDDDYEATNLPDGWVSFYDNEETSSYGGSYHGYYSHVATNNNYFGDGNNYLLMISNRTNATGSYPAVEYATYAITPYKDVYSFQFKYRYESTYQGTFEFGYVTDNTGYGTWVALDTPTKTTDVTTYTASAADLATIRANNGYVALKYGGVTSGYYFLGVDDIEVCSVEPKLWTDFVTEAPDSWTWDGTSSTINITCAEDLAWLISVVNGLNGCDPHPTAKAKLTADINMSEYIWVPIGNGTNYFSGSFDGQNHIVSGLHCNVADDCSDQFQNLGMFGMMSGAEVLNLSVSADFANSYFVDGSSSNVNTALGVLAGFAGGGSSISFCHASGALNSTREMSVGGMVGELSAASTINASSAAVSITSSDANSYVGGFAGRVYYSHLENSFANSDMTGVTGATVKGNLVGYLEGGDDTHVASANNCYVRNASGKMIGQKTSDYTSTENLYAPTAETGVAAFSSSNYNYGADNNTVGGTPLVDLLNENDGDDDYKWIRAAGSSINDGYPIVVPTGNTTLACVAKVGHKWMRFGELNDMITLYSDSTGYEVFMYNNGMLTGAPSNKLSLYIDENVAMIQSSACNPVTATVSVTLKNYAQNDGSKADVRDWHMFSSSIAAGKTGVVYGSSQGTGETLTFGSDYYLKQGDEAVYFPDGITDAIDEPGKQFDLYAFYEPEYHWVNLKRTIDNHWHQDEVEGTGQINYDGTDNADEASFTKGKGYLIALGDRNGKNNNIMQAKGVLNNVPENAEPIKAYVSNTGNHLTGYNLLGNPFQSYLSFEKFATDNYDVLWNAVPDGEDAEIGTRAYMVYDAKTGGFIEYVSDNHGASFSMGAQNVAGPYIHPHQGFFVVKNTKTGDAGDKRQVIFDNTMRDTEATGVTFRDEVLTYPLVNLHCTDSEGKWEHSVIEFDRPEMAGSLKMKGMLNAKGNMYIHWAGTDFNSLFIDHMPDFVPVWFDAAEDGVFTMTWNTANADFGYMHLIDNIAGVDYDCLANDSYTFNASTTDMSSRFRLVFKPLGIEEETTEQGENFAFVNGNELVVNGTGELNFIDLNGRVLATEYVSGQQSHLTMPNVAEGMYLLRLTNANGVKVQKVIIRK